MTRKENRWDKAGLCRADILQPRLHDTTCCQTHCQTRLTTVCIVYTNIQPVVKPVWQMAVSCIQPVVKPVVQPGLTTGWTNSCSFNTVVKPVVKPLWQPVVSRVVKLPVIYVGGKLPVTYRPLHAARMDHRALVLKGVGQSLVLMTVIISRWTFLKFEVCDFGV